MPALAAIRRHLDQPGFHYASPWHVEALARLTFAAEHGLNLAYLTGESGCGKTTALAAFRRELAHQAVATLELNLTDLSVDELRAAITEQLGLPHSQSAAQQWMRIVARLKEFGLDQTPVLILADNVHHASAEVLAFLHRLWDVASQTRLTIVLAGTPEALSSLDDSWRERVDLQIELGPWSSDEIRSLLESGAGSKTIPLNDEVISLVAELTGGIPRQVRRLLRLALIAAEGQGQSVVDVETIAGVNSELCAER